MRLFDIKRMHYFCISCLTFLSRQEHLIHTRLKTPFSTQIWPDKMCFWSHITLFWNGNIHFSDWNKSRHQSHTNTFQRILSLQFHFWKIFHFICDFEKWIIKLIKSFKRNHFSFANEYKIIIATSLINFWFLWIFRWST